MPQKKERQSPDYLLENGDVVLCDYRGPELPEPLVTRHRGSTTVLARGQDIHDKYEGAAVVRTLTNLSVIRDQTADVCFLDHSALKTLLIRFPKRARYILARIAFRGSWLVALPGLVRRLYCKEVRLRGLRRIGAGRASGLWLVIERKVEQERSTRRVGLSTDVGIAAFLDFLRNEEINYVVIRFFQKLPELYRQGGDLDMLVADEDGQRVRGFLAAHPGTIPIDVHTVSSLHNNRIKITYYPPNIARGILQRAVDGPAGSRVPAPEDEFLALAYHVLYHKGVGAGIPCRVPGYENPVPAVNDYAGELAKMANELGIDVAITMEDLDSYLASVGWRPKTDTLAKIAATNKWVWHHFFLGRESEEIGLNVLIIKKRALERQMLDAIVRMVQREGFAVVRKKVLSPREVTHAAGHLRGGDWKTASDGTDAFLPAAVLVILDQSIVETRKLGASVHAGLDLRIRAFKNKLRVAFPDPGGNLIHSTDNTAHSWEYIEVCFPHEEELIRRELECHEATLAVKPLSERIRFRTRVWLLYAKIQLRGTLLAWMTR